MNIQTEKDLQGLIDDKIQEDVIIDYKEPTFSENDKFNNELAKDVSAMANSEGGIIIFGIKEENSFPKEIIWIKNEEDKRYKERIEQIISSKIFDKIEGIKVRKVSSDDKKGFVIVIDIPQSDIAPHQVHKNSEERRYYNRYGSTTKQMEHYEIKDLFFKRKKAVLKISLKSLGTKNPSFDINIQNYGKIIAEKLFIKLLIPKEFKINGEGWTDLGEKSSPFGLYSIYQFFDNIMPVYPENCSQIGILYYPKQDLLIKNLTLGFFIVSRDSEPKAGKLVLDSDSEEKIKISEDGRLKSSELTIHPTFKEKIEYSEDKKGIPIPSVSFYD